MENREIITLIWRGNRKLILILTSVSAILVIILIAILVIKAQINNKLDRPINNVSEQTSATVVDNANLQQHIEELHNAIKQKYDARLDDFEIDPGQLLEDGTWYITTISKPQRDQLSSASDIFRIILHKDKDVWQIVAEPSLIFAYSDYPNIPRAVIYSANNL